MFTHQPPLSTCLQDLLRRQGAFFLVDTEALDEALQVPEGHCIGRQKYSVEVLRSGYTKESLVIDGKPSTEVLAVFDQEDSIWDCPRKIPIHTRPYKCGPKCKKAGDGGKWLRVKQHKVLVCTRTAATDPSLPMRGLS